MWRIRDVYPGSWILILPIPDPGSWFYPSRIPDPKTVTKERGEKFFFCHTFSFSHKFHKIVKYFIFGSLKTKIWANFQRIIELFTQKIVKNMGLGSEIRDPEKTYSGSRIQWSKRHRIPDPDPQHWEIHKKRKDTVDSSEYKILSRSKRMTFWPFENFQGVFRIRKFLCLPDPDPDLSIIKQK